MEVKDVNFEIPGNFEERAHASVDDLKYNLGVNEYPPLPTKTLICVVTLFVVGIVLFCIGFVEEVVDVDPSKGIAFWVVGVLVFTPGVYYTVMLCRAYRARTPQERLRILRDIPDMD
jgi:hypothetical protein